MGIQFSCPLACYTDIENDFESVIVKSISFGSGETRTPVWSVSFKDQDAEPTIMQSVGSVRMIEGSVSFKSGDKDIMDSFNTPLFEKNLYIPPLKPEGEISNQSVRSDSLNENSALPTLDSRTPKHQAATKLQKVYKSFRTRRKLADCAVLIEQRWWKLLDFAELEHSSVSYFNLEKQETAISLWSRARTRATKVGKGLSKNNKARKLALQHWLEAIDPRHRYGHNLRFYYVKWLPSQSIEPFFYWLDIGEGKEINLVEKCPRSKLQQQCIKYLGPKERMVYEVVIEDGQLLFKQTGEFLDTTKVSRSSKWIFVLSTSRTLYVGTKKKGTFQHSSFLAGGATLAARRILVENGILKAVWPHSGHYRPTPENFQDFLSFLKENDVDLTNVKSDGPVDEDESPSKKSVSHIRNNSSDEDMSGLGLLVTEEADAVDLTLQQTSLKVESWEALDIFKQNLSGSLSQKLPNIDRPKGGDLIVKLNSENDALELSCNSHVLEKSSQSDGYETAEESCSNEQNVKVAKQTMVDEDNKTTEETILQEYILKRINSHKGMKSYQLGIQLSCKWSTGAGPRIGCVRDYPSALQSHALEQVNLSPRNAPFSRSRSGVIQGATTTATVESHSRSSQLFKGGSGTFVAGSSKPL